jgi:hypothetical protein
MAFALLTITLGVLLGGDGFRLPNRDWQLDQHAFRALDGAEVTAVLPSSIHLGGRDLVRVQYRGVADGTPVEGECYVFAPGPAIGKRERMEYLPDDHRTNRLCGGAIAVSTFWMPWLTGAIYLPLLLLCGYWSARSWRLLVLLRNGPAATAVLVRAVATRHVNPPQVKVRYAFDSPAGRIEGGHWLAAKSPLAQRALATAPGGSIDGAAVVYDEMRPQRNRLLAQEDAEADVS